MKRILTLIALCIVSGVSASTRQLQIIPQPVKAELRTGVFVTAGCRVEWEGFDIRPENLAALTGRLVKPCHPASTWNGVNAIVLRPDYAYGLPAEGYRIDISARRAQLSAGDDAGLFYGLQSLQLEADERGNLPCVSIEDHPRYRYRGLHLDVCRHFFPVRFIKHYLDWMASCKLNTFHWHYNDGTAWRVESDAFPKLTEVGAWWGDSAGGFYTKEDVKAIVDYARERFITVVPEVEMPAHANAALYAYPDNACQKEQLLEGKHGDANTASWFLRPYWVATYCASREETYDFIDRLIAETVELFPDSKIIHIGGDELPSGAWEACPRCKAFMQEKGLAGEVELQNYFTRRVEEIVARHGRRALGWEQVMADNLRPDTMIHAYLSQEMVARAAAAGYEVFSNNAGCNYFDYYQGSQADEPLAITSGMTTVKQTYTFDPMARVPEELRSKVLGGQGALWTEFISTPAQADYMFFPRMTAMSEKVWSAPERCGWQEFERRLNFFYPRLSQFDVHYKDYRK